MTYDPWEDISSAQQSLVKAIFMLFIAISGNFLAQLFPCRIQYLFTNNMVAKHVLGFIILFFTVVINSVDHKKSTLVLILLTIGFYIWFVIMTRMTIEFFVPLIAILSVLYLIGIHIDVSENANKTEENKVTKEFQQNKIKKLKKIKIALFFVAIIVTIMGFLLYLGEKNIEYGKNFKLSSFFLGEVKCKHDTPDMSIFKKLDALV